MSLSCSSRLSSLNIYNIKRNVAKQMMRKMNVFVEGLSFRLENGMFFNNRKDFRIGDFFLHIDLTSSSNVIVFGLCSISVSQLVLNHGLSTNYRPFSNCCPLISLG